MYKLRIKWNNYHLWDIHFKFQNSIKVYLHQASAKDPFTSSNKAIIWMSECLLFVQSKVYLSTPNENWPLKIIVSQNFSKIYKSLKLLKRETFNEDKIKFKKMELVKENSTLFVQNLKNLCQLWLTGSASTLWYNQLTQNLLGLVLDFLKFKSKKNSYLGADEVICFSTSENTIQKYLTAFTPN